MVKFIGLENQNYIILKVHVALNGIYIKSLFLDVFHYAFTGEMVSVSGFTSPLID
jgi:hypothetical protein